MVMIQITQVPRAATRYQLLEIKRSPAGARQLQHQPLIPQDLRYHHQDHRQPCASRDPNHFKTNHHILPQRIVLPLQLLNLVKEYPQNKIHLHHCPLRNKQGMAELRHSGLYTLSYHLQPQSVLRQLTPLLLPVRLLSSLLHYHYPPDR